MFLSNLYASSDNSPTPQTPSQFCADWVDVVLRTVWLIEKSTLFGWRTEKCLQVTQNYNSTILQPFIFVAIVLLCVYIFASHLTAGKNQPLRCLAFLSFMRCTMYYGKFIMIYIPVCIGYFPVMMVLRLGVQIGDT